MPMTAPTLLPHVEVDFNVRSREGWVRTRLDKVPPGQELEVGSTLWVFEREEGLRGLASVAEVDHERGLLYLDVEWDSIELGPQQTSNTNWELQKGSRGRLGIKVPDSVVDFTELGPDIRLESTLPDRPTRLSSEQLAKASG
ncbi:MAG: hypothetical protein WD250_07285 [Egibacteraceae bacterium]